MAKTSTKNYQYVECRVNHMWEATQVTKAPLFGKYLWMKCQRCGMIRKDTVNANGTVAARSYVQPEGYYNPEIGERAAYRKEMVRRIEAGIKSLPIAEPKRLPPRPKRSVVKGKK